MDGHRWTGQAVADLPAVRHREADRYVGIFYFLWLGQHGTGGPYDISKILAANPTNPQWGPVSAFHHWHESELGYYLSDDDYVIRKHAAMLANAGVDVIIFDVTNGFTYQSNYLLLCSVYRQIRQAGGQTPQIAFLTHSSTRWSRRICTTTSTRRISTRNSGSSGRASR